MLRERMSPLRCAVLLRPLMARKNPAAVTYDDLIRVAASAFGRKGGQAKSARKTAAAKPAARRTRKTAKAAPEAAS